MNDPTARCVVLVVGLVAGMPAPAADAPPGRVPAAKRAVEPAAPVLPAEVVAAMQERRYADAVAALDKLARDPKADAPYLALVRGIALRLDRKLDDARAGLRAAIDAAPEGPLAAKLRGELAAVELAAGHFDAAERLARAEAERLLAGDRKDRLAEVYHGFARRLLKPEEPTTPADPEGAYALLNQARGLAKGDVLRARLLFAMADASQRANNPPRAIQDYQSYLGAYPKGADRVAARFHLGEAQLAAGQPLPARLTWTDLARDLEMAQADRPTRASSLYWIARTYGIPAPADDSALNLGVAALRRVPAADASHPLAVRAAYEVGTSYLARGKSQEALDALTAFIQGEGYEAKTDEAKKEQAGLLMAAQFQVGQVLQGQEKFAEAIDAFKGYLAKFPDGPQSADAQRAILDTQLLIAQDHLRQEHYAEARAAWQAFAAQNPLDARVPPVLFQVGASFAAQEKFDEAIAAWETLAGKFPGTEPAAHAQFQAALIHEEKKGDPEAALERYKAVAVEPWQSQARQRAAVLEAKALTVVTPRAFRLGETAQLKIATRNLEKLNFTAYKLAPEAYFRKKQSIGGVEALDIGLVAPDAEWTTDVPGYARYKPIETAYDLKALAVPGVWVVKVSDDKTLQATTLVLGSDLEAIVKASRDQVLVFAQDMKTGQGRAGARVLISDGSGMVLEDRTGADGVLLKGWPRPRDPNSGLAYLVLDGKDVAGSGLAVPGQVSQGLTPRAYIYTDRPAYRPGQEVELRGVVREVKDGQYAHQPGAEYRLEVIDSRGRLLVARPVRLSEFGTFRDRLAVDEGAPVGTYRVRLFQPGKSDFAGQFEVQAYQLEKVDLAFDLPRTVYYRGETIQADLVARYQYGTPLADRPIAVQLPDGRVLSGRTDAAGKYHVELTTEGFAEEQTLSLAAQLPQDNLAATATVMLAVRAFRIDLTTPRDVYLDGEGFTLKATTLDAQGGPTAQELSVAVLKRVERAGRTTERPVTTEAIKTDAKAGVGTLALKVDDAEGGSYIVRASGTDRFGNPVVAERALTISGTKDRTKLRLLAERTSFRVGETAEVKLHSRAGAGTALVAWEADRVLRYRLVALKEGDNPLSWDVDGAQFPNFTLTAARMAGTEFHQARLDVRVERDLRVEIKPTRPTVGPGAEVEVEVTTADQLGRPVAAEVSLALVDRALLRLHGEVLPAIGPYFYGQERRGSFATESTITFRYAPATVPVAEAVVEETERALADRQSEQAAGEVREQAQRQVAMGYAVNGAAVTSAPAPPAGPGGGGFGPGGEISTGGRPDSAGRSRPTRAPTAEEYLNSDKKAMAKDRGSDESHLAMERRVAGLSEMEAKLGRDGAEPAPRERFVETAYWNPSVITGKDGKARVTFRAPMALSRYQFTARGVTGAETLVGQTTADLAVRKDFFVDLRTPASLTQGDRPRFAAQVHHQGVVGTLDLRLTVYAGGREVVQPRKLELKADGVEEVLFDPFEVPDGDSVRLTLSASAGPAADELVAEVPIRPWGVQAIASAAGTASDDATAFVALPPGRTYEHPEMLIVLSPTLRRMLVELALGQQPPAVQRQARIGMPTPGDTLADHAGDLLAATAVLGYLQTTHATDAPEAARLSGWIQGLVAELVAAQNDDGGWPWVGGPGARPSDRLTSARAAFALRGAWRHGLMTDPKTVDRAVAYLQQELARVAPADQETRVALLHALGVWEKATFEQANALNRSRQDLPDVALAYLALTFADLDRAALAGEVLDVLAARSKVEPAPPGGKPLRSWLGAGQQPWHRDPVETTALAALALARVRPGSPELDGAVAWLESRRTGSGWQPHKAQGPALAALAAYHGGAKAAEDRYRLVVTVNDREVYNQEIAGAAEGQSIPVPLKALKVGDRNRVHFDLEGRGTYGYAVTLTGFARDFAPEQTQADRPFYIYRHVYGTADPELDGKVLPTGFGVAVNPQTFENQVTQVPPGGRARVQIDATRVQRAGQPDWERDFLILEEHLPAGTTLVEGSVVSQAGRFELSDGVLRFYFAPDQWPGSIRYDVFGYLPGRYRALPAQLASAYEPGRRHLGPAGELTVLAPGEKSTDPYRATPDELYARGKAHFDAARLADATGPLEELSGGYALRDDVARDSARMLLACHIAKYDARKVVQYFEVLKQKAPELVIPFDQIRVVGQAYADIGEHERAYLVWRAIAEASSVEDAQVGEVLRQRGKGLEGLAYLIELWREYPGSASLQSDFFGLSQLLASKATQARADPAARRELTAAGLTRPELLLQAIRTAQVFLTLSPADPLADEASLALVGDFLELEDDAAVVKLAERFAKLYPRSTYLDSFQYAEALGRFHLGEYDRAIAVAEAIARATYKDAGGVEQPSPNKWQALYILGQIHDARRQPARALAYYEQVADRFGDAAGAVKGLKREELSLPEVAVIRPKAAPTVAGPGLRAVPAEAPSDRPEKPGVTLSYRNIARADVTVYPVDLMKLYLTRRNLAGIASIDLAGITPLVERSIALGDGADYDDKIKDLDLPLESEGAFLVMVRGGEHYASGIVLVSPLELVVLEEAESGRVRVTVRDALTKDPVPKVQVKVIGTENPAFLSGVTDLRGVFVAEGVRGQVTAVARQGAKRYAFHRGTQHVGAPPAAAPPTAEPGRPQSAQPAPSEALDANLQQLNGSNQRRQIDRLQRRYEPTPSPAGVQVQQAK